MTFVILLLILIALILVHEFGHFIIAKAFKIRVDEFGIFFPPRIAARKFGETIYSLNWLPFGGFVRIFGENPKEGAGDPRSISQKPRLVQAAVIVAGVVFNVLFAWLILSAGYMVGMPTSAEQGVGEVKDVRVMILEVVPDSPAQKAGLMPEDVVVHVETATAQLPKDASAQDITDFIAAHQEQSVILGVLRNGEEKTFLAKPAAGVVGERKVIGVQLADIGTLQLPPHVALLQGGYLTYRMTLETAQGLAGFFGRLFSGAADFSGVAGPIGIVTLGGAFIEQGYVAIIILTASLSIALAIFNLIPVPGLDGGRLLFIAVEAVIRRPLPQRFSLALTVAGFGLLILLMLVVSYHDIARLVS